MSSNFVSDTYLYLIYIFVKDWLGTEFEDMTTIVQNISVAKTWMNTMAEGMAMNDIAIQFCQPTFKFIFQSVEMPTVVQVRTPFYTFCLFVVLVYFFVFVFVFCFI